MKILIHTIINIVELLHNSHLRDRGKWLLKRGGSYGEVGVLHDTCLFGVHHLVFQKMFILAYVYQHVSRKQKLNNRNRDQRHAVQIKFGNLLQCIWGYLIYSIYPSLIRWPLSRGSFDS